MFKKFTDAEKTSMNKKALAIVKGWIAVGFISAAFIASLPSSAKSDEIDTAFKNRLVATLPMEIRNKEWRKLGEEFEAKSKAHYGESRQNHFCQPTTNSCDTYNYYPIKNKLLFIHEIVDIGDNDRIYVREICLVNKYVTVRECSNFDTGSRHKDKKDVTGSWHTVSGSWK